MRRHLPPLNALKAFEAAARHGSFKHAADELFVSHSAVSHQIKQLELYLGVELFLRVSRGVKLSGPGQAYYPVVRDALERIAEGTEAILKPESSSILTIQVYSTFAIRWLIPRLPDFQARHPKVLVRLHTSQSDVNFEHEDVDLCVMIGRRNNDDLRYDYLFSSRVFPVCSPSLLNGDMPLDTPSDLAQHTIIQVYPSPKDWRAWLEENRVEGVDPDSGLQFDSYDLAFATATRGMGVALGIEPFVNRELEAGSLVEVFEGKRVYTRGNWFLVCRAERADMEKVGVFREWLMKQVLDDPSMLRQVQYERPPMAAA